MAAVLIGPTTKTNNNNNKGQIKEGLSNELGQ
jgi:hypothetical protein